MSKYSQLKIFHFKEKIDSLPKEIDKVEPPIHIRIKPTNVCAHNCWYCAYKVDNLQLGKDMVTRDYIPKEKMFEIIDDCVEMGVKAITFSGGGDPFYYQHLLETVKKLKDTNIKFASLTNGAKLDGELAEVFAHHATWIRISIDGWDDKSYAEFRGIKEGEFTKVINNMKNFKKLGGQCALGVSFIVDDKNYKHLYDFVKLIKSTGADSIKISPCIVDNDGKKNNEYHIKIYDEVKRQTALAKKDFACENFEIFDSYHLLEEKFEKDYNWCPFAQILPVIGADCKIYPCHDKAYNDEATLGDISKKRFKDVWSEKSMFFKVNPSKMCHNHCVANSKNKMILEYLETDNEHMEFV